MEAGANQFTQQLVIEVKAVAGKTETSEAVRAHDLVH
jgi:hypothetical protein